MKHATVSLLHLMFALTALWTFTSFGGNSFPLDAAHSLNMPSSSKATPAPVSYISPKWTATPISFKSPNATHQLNSPESSNAAQPYTKLNATLPSNNTTATKLSISTSATQLSNNTKVAQPSNKPASPANYKIVGYYTSWSAYGDRYRIADIRQADKLTHLNYAFADICWNGKHGSAGEPLQPCESAQPATVPAKNGSIARGDAALNKVKNGAIVLGDPAIDKSNFEQLRKLKKQHPHLRTLLSVGGWSWSNRFSDMAATATTRGAFADSAVAFVRAYPFDGVDLDWEYPVSGGLAGNSARPEDKRNFTLLLQAIRAKLDAAGKQDGKRYLLTIAAGIDPSYIRSIEPGPVAAAVDWINLMTYDFNGDWQKTSGHNAPLRLDPAAVRAKLPAAKDANDAAAVRSFEQAGIPAGRLVLGVPLYGRGWTGCSKATAASEYAGCAGPAKSSNGNGTFAYDKLTSAYVGKNGYTRRWNAAAQVPYLFQASTRTFISYDDAESVGLKADFVRAKKLAGAMFWELSGNEDGTLVAVTAARLGAKAASAGNQ